MIKNVKLGARSYQIESEGDRSIENLMLMVELAVEFSQTLQEINADGKVTLVEKARVLLLAPQMIKIANHYKDVIEEWQDLTDYEIQQLVNVFVAHFAIDADAAELLISSVHHLTLGLAGIFKALKK